jgi:alpha-beta hydrolase superfamily lysophospholipase
MSTVMELPPRDVVSERLPDESGGEDLRLVTDQGCVRCRLHEAAGDASGAAVLWGFGAGGGLGGPAGGIYERLARGLRRLGHGSLQVAWRHPAQLEPCVRDVHTGIAFLATRGLDRVVLVGHSFGGAVVIRAGVESERVVAVAALSSQVAGTERVHDLAPKPLLLVHGEADEALPDSCSLDIHRRAREPKELVLYPGCRHGLDGCRDALDRDLSAWLEEKLAPPGRRTS